MKITIKPRHNSHKNDCWCDAIALLTKQDYNKVYKMFKPMLYKSGGLDDEMIKGYFHAKKYFVLDSTVRLYEAINLYNTTNGIIFIMNDIGTEDYHTIYMKGNVIYDNQDNTYIQKMLYDYKVLNVIMKLENDYE